MNKFSPANVMFIQNRACERINEVLDALGLDYTERHDYIQCACPVHAGDNPRGMYWLIKSNHWKCATRGCHLDPITGPSTSVFGIVRGVMSRKTETPWNFHQAVTFISQALGLEEHQEDTMTAQRE